MATINKQAEKAAAEYLTAFITHLFNQGKSGYEIADALQIHITLIYKLISDRQMLDTLDKRNNDLFDSIKAATTDTNEFETNPNHYHLRYSIKYNRVLDFSKHKKNIDSWQRKFKFNNAIDFYFNNQKKYSDTDNEVLTLLRTGTQVTELTENFSDRDLSPDYKLRIINDISDGQTITAISKKYNCSEYAINQTAHEHNLTFPVTAESIRARVVQAINEGYSFEQLNNRFINMANDIKDLIKIHRLQPA